MIKKTEIIVREDGSVFQEVDYLDDILIRTKIVTGEIKVPLYYLNEFGGLSLIDKYGCSDYYAFRCVMDLLKNLIKAQCNARMSEPLADKNLI